MDTPVSYKTKKLQEGASSSEEGTDLVQKKAITRLARSTIQLSQIAPRLSQLASDRQAVARRQAEQLSSSADMVRTMTSTLQHTMSQLRLSTNEIGELTSLINRIADETRMISINAGIVAAQTGDQGRAFAVLAKEIRALSENTTNATRDVNVKVQRLEENTQRTVEAVGLDHEDSEGSEHPGLAKLLAQLEDADAAAQQQVVESRELNALGNNLRSLSEEMIGAVGTFRLHVHDRIDGLVAALSRDPGLCSGDPRQQMATLRNTLKRNPFVELAYITDADGIQALENVTRANFHTAYAGTGKQKNWSNRGWFLGAKRNEGVYLSPIYRSEATDEFCLTASCTFAGPRGQVMGVVAMDVNFREILGE